MFSARALRGLAGMGGGAALYQCVATRRADREAAWAGTRAQGQAATWAWPSAPTLRIPLPMAWCEASGDGGPSSLLLGVGAAAVVGGIAYYLNLDKGGGSDDFDFASTPIVSRTEGAEFPEFAAAQEAQARGNLKLAFEFYLKAAEKGSVQATTAVGAYYDDDHLDFMKQDTHKAFEYFEKAAKKGEVDAMVRLGMFYDLGTPPAEKNSAKANKLFAVAADRGDPEAMFYLAWAYYKGDGLAKDPAKGRELLESAKARGHTRAAEVLASLDRENA